MYVNVTLEQIAFLQEAQLHYLNTNDPKYLDQMVRELELAQMVLGGTFDKSLSLNGLVTELRVVRG